MGVNLALFLISLVLLWIGAGLAVNSVNRISHSLHIRSFTVSFFVLGLFTSITEIMVGVNSVIQKQPDIFVGNLIGSSVVVFLLIVPLLAVFGGKVNLNHAFSFRDLITAVLVVGMPALLTLDNRFSFVDALSCIVLYVFFAYTQERNSKPFEKLVAVSLGHKFLLMNLVKILAAVALVFLASNILVHNTIVIGNRIGISPYILSILVLSVGTNVPELSIALRAILEKKKDIAFGNYVGSASLNTVEMGILALVGGTPVAANGSNYSVLAFLTGLLFFLYFGKSKNSISRIEGLGLLLWYLTFVVCELVTGPGWII